MRVQACFGFLQGFGALGLRFQRSRVLGLRLQFC